MSRSETFAPLAFIALAACSRHDGEIAQPPEPTVETQAPGISDVQPEAGEEPSVLAIETPNNAFRMDLLRAASTALEIQIQAAELKRSALQVQMQGLEAQDNALETELAQ
jgi:hypothetical protein